MNKENKYNIYFGLLKSDMETRLNKEKVLKDIISTLKHNGVLGCNVQKDFIGYWNGKEEPALKISFINTFKIKETTLKEILSILKTKYEQESVLIEKEAVQYGFI